MTSKELYLKTFKWQNFHDRAPRQLGWVGWTLRYHKDALEHIWHDFPMDNDCPRVEYHEHSKVAHNDTVDGIGTSVDSWGCKWTMLQYGITGEVKDPIVTDDDWEDTSRIVVPEENLSFDIEQVNQSCREKKEKLLIGCECISVFERRRFV